MFWFVSLFFEKEGGIRKIQKNKHHFKYMYL